MNVEFSRPIILRSAFVLGLLIPTASIHAQLATTTPDTLSASSSSSYGLLDSFAAPAPPPSPSKNPEPHHIETSVSLGVFPQLTATRLTYPGNVFYTSSMTPSAGLLATFRQNFRPWLGYSINFGYTRATEHQTTGAYVGPTGAGNRNIPANMFEFSFAYVAEKHITPRLTGFADLGGGMIDFESTNAGFLFDKTSYRPEGLAGIGFDYHLTRHLGIRAEYRGQLYKFADYGSGEGSRPLTVTSEPTISLTYNFGKSKH